MNERREAGAGETQTAMAAEIPDCQAGSAAIATTELVELMDMSSMLSPSLSFGSHHIITGLLTLRSAQESLTKQEDWPAKFAARSERPEATVPGWSTTQERSVPVHGSPLNYRHCSGSERLLDSLYGRISHAKPNGKRGRPLHASVPQFTAARVVLLALEPFGIVSLAQLLTIGSASLHDPGERWTQTGSPNTRAKPVARDHAYRTVERQSFTTANASNTSNPVLRDLRKMCAEIGVSETRSLLQSPSSEVRLTESEMEAQDCSMDPPDEKARTAAHPFEDYSDTAASMSEAPIPRTHCNGFAAPYVYFPAQATFLDSERQSENIHSADEASPPIGAAVHEVPCGTIRQSPTTRCALYEKMLSAIAHALMLEPEVAASAVRAPGVGARGTQLPTRSGDSDVIHEAVSYSSVMNSTSTDSESAHSGASRDVARPLVPNSSATRKSRQRGADERHGSLPSRSSQGLYKNLAKGAGATPLSTRSFAFTSDPFKQLSEPISEADLIRSHNSKGIMKPTTMSTTALSRASVSMALPRPRKRGTTYLIRDHCNDSCSSKLSSALVETSTVDGNSVLETPEAVIGHNANKKTINQYVVLRLLGRGAYGKVKLAQNSKTGELVAVKVLQLSGLKRGNMQLRRELVQREIAVMKSVRHKHTVRLLEVIGDMQSAKIYMVMQYMPNGTISRRVGPTTIAPIKENLLRSYAKQLLGALSDLHRRNIFHRDIKPENVLLGENDMVYLGDFGVSVVCSEEGVVGVEGTPAFMAPELCRGELAVHGDLVDVWAFGVMLYQLAYGILPFIGQTPLQLTRSIVNSPLVFPDEVTESEDASGSSSHCLMWSAYTDEDAHPEDRKQFLEAQRIHMDSSFKEMIRGLLEKVPSQRWTLRKAMTCAWIKGDHESDDTPDSDSVDKSLVESTDAEQNAIDVENAVVPLEPGHMASMPAPEGIQGVGTSISYLLASAQSPGGGQLPAAAQRLRPTSRRGSNSPPNMKEANLCTAPSMAQALFAQPRSSNVSRYSKDVKRNLVNRAELASLCWGPSVKYHSPTAAQSTSVPHTGPNSSGSHAGFVQGILSKELVGSSKTAVEQGKRAAGASTNATFSVVSSEGGEKGSSAPRSERSGTPSQPPLGCAEVASGESLPSGNESQTGSHSTSFHSRRKRSVCITVDSTHPQNPPASRITSASTRSNGSTGNGNDAAYDRPPSSHRSQDQPQPREGAQLLAKGAISGSLAPYNSMHSGSGKASVCSDSENRSCDPPHLLKTATAPYSFLFTSSHFSREPSPLEAGSLKGARTGTLPFSPEFLLCLPSVPSDAQGGHNATTLHTGATVEPRPLPVVLPPVVSPSEGSSERTSPVYPTPTQESCATDPISPAPQSPSGAKNSHGSSPRQRRLFSLSSSRMSRSASTRDAGNLVLPSLSSHSRPYTLAWGHPHTPDPGLPQSVSASPAQISTRQPNPIYHHAAQQLSKHSAALPTAAGLATPGAGTISASGRSMESPQKKKPSSPSFAS